MTKNASREPLWANAFSIHTYCRSHYVPEQAYGNSKAAQVLMTLYLDSMVSPKVIFFK